MGCDIHLFVERRNHENQWVDGMIYEHDRYKNGFQPLSEMYRDYTLFATLAGVRGDEPITLPKGIPEDCSPEYKKLCDDWGDDGHSHSYFTLRELLNANQKCLESRKGSLNRFILHLKNIIKMTDYWLNDERIEEEGEKYRVCFFFDN